LTELAARWKNYLAQLAETRHDFSTQVAIEGEDLLLKPSVAIEVHRIAQEAISNAFRHSKGNSIRVEIDVENQRPSVSVIDNGVGVAENPVKEGHYGLSNMKERAKRIRGDLSFRSDRSGTTVHLSWPNN
jgi:signal transduction histidine kinase